MSTMKKLQSENLPDVKKDEVFRPTPHMLVWLDTQVDLLTKNKAEIARRANIAEKTWYEWLKLPKFEDWYWPEYDKRMRRLKDTVDEIGLQYAKRGSSTHFEYLAKRVGNIPSSGNQTNVQNNNTFVVKVEDY